MSAETSALSNDVYVFPASFAQELLWLVDRASQGARAYNTVFALRGSGQLDVAAFQQALDGLMERHEILRTNYGEQDGHCVQMVAAHRTAELSIVDLTGVPASEREARASAVIRERARAPFDLTADGLLRATALRMGEADHILVLETHHIASDGWSVGIMLRELGVLYRAARSGTPADLPPLPIQFADYASWQRDHLQSERLDTVLGWWREQLAGADFTLPLPTDRPHGAARHFEGDRRSRTLPPHVASAVRRLAQEQRTTLYQTLLAAWQTLLHRYTGRQDVIVGSPVAGRDRPETAPLIGYFANTMVLRASFDDSPTFATLLQRVRETCLGAWEHQEVPFEKLVLELQKDRRPTQQALLPVVFTMVDPGATAAGLDFGDVRFTPVPTEHGTTKFDLTLFAGDRDDGIRLTLFYRTDLFDGSTADRILGHLCTLLENAAANPGQRVSEIDYLTPAEHAELGAWNDTALPLTQGGFGIHELVSAQAARVPDRIAVTASDGTLRYRDLERRANQLAHRLSAAGVALNDPVGLCLDRTTDLVVGLLGIFKAGGGYVPLPPELPGLRIAQQIQESGARVVVTVSAHRGLLPDGLEVVALDDEAAVLDTLPDEPPHAGVQPEHLAYVLFTSGSTGTPKGVAVTHANLLHYVDAIAPVLGIGVPEADGWHYGTVSTLAADLGHTSLFPSLCNGGTLHLIPREVATEPARFADYVSRQPLDILKITPSHMRALLGERPASWMLPRRVLVLGGEMLHWEFAEQLAALGSCRIVNHYGPTETTVGAAALTHEARAAARSASPAPASVPIGRPLARVRLHVLDDKQRVLPIGVPGELFIGGAGVAEGYLGRADLTAERFVPDPFSEEPGARLYRTGDRVRRISTGDIEFLGRVDFQVKIRGYRVELGEIEHAVAQLPGVRACAVVLHEAASDAAQLVAYVVADPWDESATRASLGSRLPDYMVPTTWVPLASMPLNANGKIDRSALPAPHIDAPTAAASLTPPRDEIEQTLANIWAEVLKRDVATLGVHDSFLDLGGHSLTAIRILGRVSRECGVRLPLRQLFEQPTIAHLADSIRQTRTATAVAETPAAPARLTPVARDAFRRISGPRSTEP